MATDSITSSIMATCRIATGSSSAQAVQSAQTTVGIMNECAQNDTVSIMVPRHWMMELAISS
jgi:hypothetical protein